MTTPALAAPPFERIYLDAGGDPTRIPWDRGGPDAALLAWLDRTAPAMVRTGCRVAVPGCGLGHDARELLARGYDAIAFDLSEAAIEWARRLDPAQAERYLVADLFAPPARWRRRFDLVVDCFCLQSIAPPSHRAAMAALSNLLAPRGVLVVIGHCGDRPAAEVDGPPWPLMPEELLRLAAESGLEAVPPLPGAVEAGRLRGVFSRE